MIHSAYRLNTGGSESTSICRRQSLLIEYLSLVLEVTLMNVDPISLLCGLALGLLLRNPTQSININGSSSARVEQPTKANLDVKVPSDEEV